MANLKCVELEFHDDNRKQTWVRVILHTDDGDALEIANTECDSRAIRIFVESPELRKEDLC